MAIASYNRWLLPFLGVVLSACDEHSGSPAARESRHQEAITPSALRPDSQIARPRATSNGQASAGEFDFMGSLADKGTESERLERFGTATGAITDWAQFQQFVHALDRQGFPEAKKELLLRSALGKLSRAGLTPQAIAYVEEHFGPGQVRSAMVSRIIAQSTLGITELARTIGDLQFPEERSGALDGMVVRVRELAWPDLREILGSNHSAEVAKAIGSGVALRFAEPNVDIAAQSAQFAQLSNEVGLQSDFIEGFLQYSSPAALEAMWSSFSASHSEWPKELRSLYLEKYAQYDPAEALKRIGSTEGDFADGVQTVVRAWLRKDSDAVATAFLKDPAGLSEFDADVGRLEIVNYCVTSGEFDAAAKWLTLISNDRLRGEGQRRLQAEEQ